MGHSDAIDAQLMNLRFYLTAAHDCHYLEHEQAVTLFVDPQFPMSHQIYSHLSAIGFRRSGHHVYRPHCPSCRACMPLRVSVDAFSPNRSQRRILKQNCDLKLKIETATFNENHYRLYRRYMAWRHPGSGMDNDDPESYHHIFASDWADTRMLSFYDKKELVAVAITDFIDDALSAVYTYFAPEAQQRGLGTYAILRQIELARKNVLPWLYLGYWIETCGKMAYKSRFRPHQVFDGKQWRDCQKS